MDRFDVCCNLDYRVNGRYVLYGDYLAKVKKFEGWLKRLYYFYNDNGEDSEMLEIHDYIKAMEKQYGRNGYDNKGRIRQS